MNGEIVKFPKMPSSHLNNITIFNFKLLLSLHRNAMKFQRLHTEVLQYDNHIPIDRNNIKSMLEKNMNGAGKTIKCSSKYRNYCTVHKDYHK